MRWKWRTEKGSSPGALRKYGPILFFQANNLLKSQGFLVAHIWSLLCHDNAKKIKCRCSDTTMHTHMYYGGTCSESVCAHMCVCLWYACYMCSSIRLDDPSIYIGPLRFFHLQVNSSDTTTAKLLS